MRRIMGRCLGMIHQLKVIIIKIFLIVAGLFPAHNKLMVFESFSGKQYSCNPRAIYEYMVKYHPEYIMYWCVDRKCRDHFTNKNLKIIERYSLKWLFILGFSKFWVINSRMPLTIVKPRHTIYIQTWHGTPLKKLGFDVKEVHIPKTTTAKYQASSYKETCLWDYLVSPNNYSSETFKRAFGFEKEILEYGYPRNDVLYTHNTPEYIESIKQKLGIPLDKKVILYAPTWRDNQFYEVEHYKFDLPLDLRALQERYQDQYVILLRMHSLVGENFDLSPYTGFAYDFSIGIDVNELYLVADLLITDYSSVFFDYANLRRPIIFYMYDIEEYRDVLRGFYFDIERAAPGPIAKNMSELLDVIEKFNQQGEFPDYFDSYQAFYEQYCYLESGNSTKKVVQNTIFKNRSY